MHGLCNRFASYNAVCTHRYPAADGGELHRQLASFSYTAFLAGMKCNESCNGFALFILTRLGRLGPGPGRDLRAPAGSGRAWMDACNFEHQAVPYYQAVPYHQAVPWPLHAFTPVQSVTRCQGAAKAKLCARRGARVEFPNQEATRCRSLRCFKTTVEIKQ